ncbi:MAG: TetR/AcrR family transcriptional regulator [Nitriliruptorales bacterium]
MEAPTERATGTSSAILEAARRCLLEAGFAGLSTRRIADEAGVPLSQIHYHFGSKQRLVLAVLARDDARLLGRQEELFAADLPLWKQWEQACDFLEDDLASGYVRVLQEMLAAGWSDPEVADAVRTHLQGWYGLIADVAGRAADRLGGLGPFEPAEIAALVGDAFLGAESTILLGVGEADVPSRSALRKVGALIRMLEGA